MPLGLVNAPNDLIKEGKFHLPLFVSNGKRTYVLQFNFIFYQLKKGFVT